MTAPAAESSLPDILLLAAGLGTRMRPLTADRPKGLVPVAGRPLFDHAFAAAYAEGGRGFVVNVHHQARKMAAHVEALAARHPDCRFAISDERDLLRDTGGGLKHALPLLGGDPVITLNTDTFWLAGRDTPLKRLCDRYRAGDADIVLLCTPLEDAHGIERAADFRLAPDGTISQDGPGRAVIYAGAAAISRAIAASGPEGAFSLHSEHFLKALARGRLRGIVLEAPWFHVGDPEAIAGTEEAIGALA